MIARVLALAAMGALFFATLDMITMPLWIAGMLIFVFAAIRLARSLSSMNDARTQPASWIATVVVAALSIVALPAACANEFHAASVANRTVHDLGERAQAACRRDGACPEARALCGAAAVDVTDERTRAHATRFECGDFGSLGVRFTVHYQRRNDGQTFGVGARLDVDQSVNVAGGVSVPLVTQHIVDGQDLDAVDAGP